MGYSCNTMSFISHIETQIPQTDVMMWNEHRKKKVRSSSVTPLTGRVIFGKFEFRFLQLPTLCG